MGPKKGSIQPPIEKGMGVGPEAQNPRYTNESPATDATSRGVTPRRTERLHDDRSPGKRTNE